MWFSLEDDTAYIWSILVARCYRKIVNAISYIGDTTFEMKKMKSDEVDDFELSKTVYCRYECPAIYNSHIDYNFEVTFDII